MEILTKDKMLYFNPDTLEFVRKAYDLDKPGRIKESIDLLKEWIHKQDHFVKKDFSRSYLERLLIASKGSTERTKERLDRGCTLRTLMPDYFKDFDVKNDFTFWDKLSICILPKMTPTHDRVFLCGEFLRAGYTPKVFLDAHKYSVMLAEYIRAYDYARAYHIIIDFRTPHLAEILVNFSLMDLRNLALVILEGYGVRVKGVHLLSDSKFMDVLLSFARQVVPKKIRERIYIHNSEDSLHEIIDRDILPIEYGGKEKPLKELHDDWLKTIDSKEFKEYWKEMCEARTDESKRKSGKFNEQYMGMPGSFRSLSVD